MPFSFLFEVRQMFSPSLLQLLHVGRLGAAEQQVDQAVLAREEVMDEGPRLGVAVGESKTVHLVPAQLEEAGQRHRLVEGEEQDRPAVDGAGTGPAAANGEV